MREDIESIAKELGFDEVGYCTTDVLKTRPEVRNMCAANLCQTYDKTWSCPPACGDIEEHEQRMRAFDNCVLVQTVGQLEDSFDFENIIETEQLQNERVRKLCDRLRSKDYSFVAFGAGPCMLCKECTYPDAPCRFPDRMVVSMEAAGLVVNEVCTKAGVPYNHGPNTISFTGCVCF